MIDEELLKEGITAVRAGDREKGSKLLVQWLQTHPDSESGWYWLGVCRTDIKQREYCFRRVLAINPQNTLAQKQIENLHPATTGSQPVKPAESQNEPQRPHTPPFIESTTTSISTTHKPGPSAPSVKQAPRKPNKKGTSLFAWLAVGMMAIICVGIAGVLVLLKVASQRSVPSPTAVPTVTATVTVVPTPSYQASFESSPCPFNIPDRVNVTCGFVIVPEDRSGNVADTIRLAVAFYHSTGNPPKADPIIYLQGGPGDEAISWSLAAYQTVVAPLLPERDFIVIDPRGVGYSQPSIDCEEMKDTYLSDVQGNIPSDHRSDYYKGALLNCKNELLKRGVQLSAYTSTQMAADVRDTILALGFQQADLYGISYGTRIAQLVMRNHPEVIRSAILDSVVPVEIQLFDEGVDAQEQALRTLFDDCQASASCASAYPNLETVYNEVIDQLNAQPAKVTLSVSGLTTSEQTINGASFRNVITWMLRSPQTIAATPRLIYQTRAGDHSILSLSVAMPLYAFDTISLGSYISVNCRDQVFAMSIEQLDTTVQELCQLWDVKPPLPGENDPVVSDIPTLIFAGRYDPVTPISYAAQLNGHLTHGYVAIIPDQGHAPSATGISDCPTKIIQSFLLDPNVPPDMTCASQTEGIPFVIPFDGSSPLTFEPVMVDQYQIVSQVPTGWKATSFGFYQRQGFYGDFTQVGIQRAAVSDSEWVDWLYTNFYGGQGFDQPAIKYGERSANGMTWSLYKTISNGYFVEMAFARSGNETLLVLMYSYDDEHDAFYQAVFLPMIDSTTSSK